MPKKCVWVGEFLTGVMNLATLGLANLISSAATGTDLNGDQLNVDEAFEQSLEMARFAASLATALPTDGASLEADAALEGSEVGVSELGGNATQLEFGFANGDLSGSLTGAPRALVEGQLSEASALDAIGSNGKVLFTPTAD